MDTSSSYQPSSSAPAGLFMEPPQLEEVCTYVRDLPYEQRILVMSQGFHRGAAQVACYNIKEFVQALSKREFDNPAGGVRTLDFDDVVGWLRNTIGDEVLAQAIEDIAGEGGSMAQAVEKARLTLFVRMGQYNEALSELSPEEREKLGVPHA